MKIIKAKKTKTAQSVDNNNKRFRATINVDIWVPSTGNPEQDKIAAMEELHNITKGMSQLTENPIRTSVGDISRHGEL